MVVWLLSGAFLLQGCFTQVNPTADREERVMEALSIDEARPVPPSPLTAADAVAYALVHNLDIKVAEIEAAYHNESVIASRRRLLPSLTARYSLDHTNHPNARWSESTSSGTQSLESSYSSEQTTRRSEVGAMWSVLDFGVGYLKSRQQGERVRNAEEQRRRVRQQIVLDVLTHYWRATAAESISRKAEMLRRELEEQAESIRDSVDMRILSQAEGARRELSVHGGLAELEQWRRLAIQARLELARIMGAGSAIDFELADFPIDLPDLPVLPGDDPEVLQTAALRRRPELFQQDAQERIAVEEARLALLQIAPNANLSLNLYHDPDKFLEWNNWMTVGARVSWNLLNIPARLSERRMAGLQKDLAHNRGLALAAGIIAQVGIAYSDYKLSREYAEKLFYRAATRRRLVQALAEGEKDGQTRPGEVLQERVRLLGETAMAVRAGAEVRVAGARLANAIGLDVDSDGQLVWDIQVESGSGMITPGPRVAPSISDTVQTMSGNEKNASSAIKSMAGIRVIRAEDFIAPDAMFMPGPPKDAAGTMAESISSMAEPGPPPGSIGPGGWPMTAVNLRSIIRDANQSMAREDDDVRESERRRALEPLPDVSKGSSL